MSDDQPSIDRRSVLKATAGAAAATVAMAGTGAAQSSSANVSVGDCLHLPQYITVYESCSSDSGYLIRTDVAATVESICLNGRVGVDFQDPRLEDGFIDLSELPTGPTYC